MNPFGSASVVSALSVATFLAVRATRRQTLRIDGAIAGFVVGFLMVLTGLRGMVLFFFYQLGSWATKYKKQFKAQLDASVEQHSVRGARQVLAVSILATFLSLYHALTFGAERSIHFQKDPLPSQISCAVLAHHATSLADTLASELGMVFGSSSSGISSYSSPVLITQPWRHVPTGTNGGVTLAGTLWSVAGGLVIAILTLAMDFVSGTPIFQPLRLIVFGACCGVIGSLIDSLLGATVQVTYFDGEAKRVTTEQTASSKHICGRDWLTNEQVNFVSTIVTTILGGWVLGPMILE